ncbi:MAG: prepilin-type N-terminal cleavage/methylation domain-containing protein [Candidatus Omnitrophica bacterium]|nr:prepilin-type N-terminal cleavage/methylation domain-containing protein [Candidatus Omnitrophota bacterium]
MALKSNLNKRGFSLLEVVIAVGILSVGIITVVQALTYSSRVAGVASDYVRALFLVTDKLQELEFQEKLIPPGYAKQDSGEQGRFKWNYTIEQDQGTALNKLNLGINWVRRDRQEALNLVTYLR